MLTFRKSSIEPDLYGLALPLLPVYAAEEAARVTCAHPSEVEVVHGIVFGHDP